MPPGTEIGRSLERIKLVGSTRGGCSYPMHQTLEQPTMSLEQLDCILAPIGS
jgi:hypothetical protein